MATTVRVDSQLAATLRALSIEEGRPISQVIEDALSQYQKEKFWREVEDSVNRLRANPVAWKVYRDEIRFFEGGSMDGLEDEESYYTKAELGDILGQQYGAKAGEDWIVNFDPLMSTIRCGRWSQRVSIGCAIKRKRCAAIARVP